MHHSTDRITHTSRGALAGSRNSSLGLPHEGSILLRCVCVCAIFNPSLFVMNTTIHCTLLPSSLATANMVLRMGLQGVGALKIVLA